jgi:CRP-like cAMP-binding protein
MNRFSHTNHSRGRGISSAQAALLSRAIFDIPPRTRNLIALAGVAGIVVVAVGSLNGGSEQTIQVDKILHFTGYFILAFLFVLALRPVLYVPALLALVAGGFLIEVLQPYNGRQMDVADGIANTLGVAVGAFVALLVRGAFSYVRRELAVAQVKRNLMHFGPKSTILREGARVRTLYVIKSGEVKLSKMVDGKCVEFGQAQAGDVVGTLGVLLGMPQFCTVEAVSPTTVYRMELMELMNSAGGHEQPVGVVLRSLAENLRVVAERAAKNESQLQELTVATETHHEPQSDLWS